MLSISMARCVIAQRIPTVGIWRYVVDVPGSVNRSGVRSLYIKQAPCTVIERRASDICLHMFVCMRKRVVPDMEFPRWEFCLWKGSPLFLGTACSDHQCEVAQLVMPPSISIITSSYGEGFCLPVRASHTHIIPIRCLIFSGGLSLLIPGNGSCRGSRSGIFRA